MRLAVALLALLWTIPSGEASYGLKRRLATNKLQIPKRTIDEIKTYLDENENTDAQVITIPDW